MTRDQQDEFNAMIGELDHVLSRMMIAKSRHDAIGEANRQTLKHHAEDMIGAGRSILAVLSEPEPKAEQPEPKVGDRVRVTRACERWTGYAAKLGDEGALIRVDHELPAEDDAHYYVGPLQGWAAEVEVIEPC